MKAEEGKASMISPAEVLKYQKPTPGFLCPISANEFGIRFGKFAVRDATTNEILLAYEPDESEAEPVMVDDASRTIHYKFPKAMLKMKQIGTMVEFKVGTKEVKNFRMIERHYFKDKLLRSYDFTFGFCIPNSKNTWEVIYALPPLKESEITDIVNNPAMTKSDSFYFVGNKLIMHHKADYEYTL